jgi:hypothetical protein
VGSFFIVLVARGMHKILPFIEPSCKAEARSRGSQARCRSHPILPKEE